MSSAEIDFQQFLGKALDGLPVSERTKLTGCWIATELYSPDRLPLRVIAAAGRNVRECALELMRRGFDPARYYYTAVPALFEE